MIIRQPPASATSLDDAKQARVADRVIELRSRYRGILKPDAPAWSYLVHHTEETLTPARAQWGQYGALFDWMPYFLAPMEGLDARCITNRRYKPMGYPGGSHFYRYERARAQHMSGTDFEALRVAGIVDEDGYLHDDRSSPRERQYLRPYRNKLRAMVAPYLCQL